MAGMVSWIVCGALAGYIMSYLISGRDKGLVLLTVGVGVAGGICGGFVAQVCGQGTSATFSFYAALFAVIGAALSLLTYRRLMGV
ncbi:MAG TPA: hypothetical protein VFG04_21970 [Planctomycetaceae bacterium]|jgi:uncharacterized membrane protein YeaQ/YmgE (transglycosylase-associated protein family)|nr:hypothetical protein [Planctomycetaceae bacterium]